MNTSRIGAAPRPIAEKIVRQRVDPPDALDEESGDREDEEDLAELRGLELDEAEVDPALRAADRLGGDEDDDHQRERRAVDELPVPACEIDRDHGGDDEPGDADRGGDSLTDDEVALVSGHVEARDARDDPEPVADERRCRREQNPVETPKERDRRGLGSARTCRIARLRGFDQSSHRHQSVSTTIAGGASTPKKRSKTLRAAGAAALEPWPPFSISAHTTSRAESDGPQPHHQDWSSRWSLG